jgi:hypothetical protein
MRRLVKFWKLAPAERRLLFDSLGWLVAVRVALWVLPLRRILAYLKGLQLQTSEFSKNSQVSPAQIAWAIRTAGRYLPGGENCLGQSLATQAMLARRGFVSELHIGAAREDGEFKAHAWVECEGQIIIGAAGDSDILPPYDLHIQWGERKTPAEPPEGETLTQLLWPNGQGYTLVDTGKNYLLHLSNTGEFHISRDLRTVTAYMSTEVDPSLAGLFVLGGVMACIFALSGEPTLHGSAVAVGGKALAFLNESGMGKSSLAGILCANGADFITDDLLRLHPDGENWRCYPGSGYLRLRQSAAAIIEKFPVALRETTVDKRIAIRLGNGSAMPRLNALIIPRLSRECRALELERIPASKALLYLMAFPRIQESSRKEDRQRQLDFLGQVAARVPLYEALIPWGLPYPDDLAPSLLRVVRGVPPL